MEFNRKQLENKYKDADIDFLLMMLENKDKIIQYENNILENDLEPLYKKFSYEVVESIISYLSDKERTYFDNSDLKNISSIIKRVKRIAKEYNKEILELYTEMISEVYNYQRLYTLWMLEVKYDDTNNYVKPTSVAGESEDKSVISDPGFDDKKLKDLLSDEVVGKDVKTRLDTITNNMSNKIESHIKSNISNTNRGKVSNYDNLYSGLNDVVSESTKKAYRQAFKYGVQHADEIALGDIYAQNEFFLRKFQRVEHLDNRSCLVCAKLDGQTFDNRLGQIHPNCRGLDVPCKLDAQGNILYRAGIRGKRRRSDSFDRWFNKLSKADKQKLLGKKKYEMFKEGKFTLDDIVKGIRVKSLGDVKLDQALKGGSNMIKNSSKNANELIKAFEKRLPIKDISKLSNSKDVLAYHRYINQKEMVYNLLSDEELKKMGLTRQKVNSEIKSERKKLHKVDMKFNSDKKSAPI